MEHPQDKEIELCTNEVPGITNGHALRGHSCISFYTAETFKNLLLMDQWPEYIDI